MAKLKSGKQFKPLIGVAKFPRINKENKAEFLEIEFETLDYKTARAIELASTPDLKGVPFSSKPGEKYGKPEKNSPEFKAAAEVGFEFSAMAYVYSCCSRSIDFEIENKTTIELANQVNNSKNKRKSQRQFAESMAAELESIGLTYPEIVELTEKIAALHKGNAKTMLQLLENFLNQEKKSE